MNELEYMLVKITEECAEVAQAASKIACFGKDNHHPNRPGATNEEELLTEFYQLCAVMEFMQAKKMLRQPSESEQTKIKTEKMKNIITYQQVSISECCLQKPPEKAFWPYRPGWCLAPEPDKLQPRSHAPWNTCDRDCKACQHAMHIAEPRVMRAGPMNNPDSHLAGNRTTVVFVDETPRPNAMPDMQTMSEAQKQILRDGDFPTLAKGGFVK